jgi:hypothetical protein
LKHRKGLSESLEQYAARFTPPVSPDVARTAWRIQGLFFLDVVPPGPSGEDLVPLVTASVPVIAPGIPCPTSNAAIWTSENGLTED